MTKETITDLKDLQILFEKVVILLSSDGRKGGVGSDVLMCDRKTVWVANRSSYDQIKIDDILYLESDNQYTSIYVKNGNSELKTYTSSRGIGEWEKELKAHLFCRIHRKHLVNVKHILSYQRGEGGIVILSDGIHLNVSKKGKERFLEVVGIK